MKKKVLFLAAAAFLSIVCSTKASAQHSEQAPSGQMLYYRVYYNLYREGQLIVDGDTIMAAIVTYPGTPSNTNTHAWGTHDLPTGTLVIPDSIHYDGYSIPVVGIEQYTFMQCDGLTSVALPSTLKSIGNGAFYGCDSLEAVMVPSAMSFTDVYGTNGQLLGVLGDAGIKAWTFANCPRLSGSITIPNGVTYIGESAFQNSAITSVTFPSSLTYIGESAFRNTAVTSVTFPSSLTYIDNFAFYNSAIESLDLPSSLRVIGGLAFGYCRHLQGVITLPDSLTAIVGGAFAFCYKVLSINIPDSAHIYSFENYPEFNSRTFWRVNNINWNRNLDVEAWSAGGLSVLGAKTFNGYIENGLVYRDQNKTEVTGCDYSQTNFSLPTSVDSIGQHAFSSHSSLNQIALSEGLEKIGEYAFGYCSGLTDITLPASLEKIGEHAFVSCSGLADITLPASLTSLEFGAFAYCESLDTLRMLGSVPPAYINSYFWYTDSTWVYDSSLVDVPIVVPCHAGSAYRNAAGWSICNNIIDPCGDEVIYYTVTVNSTDTTMGTVSAGGEVEEGESFTIRAIANEGYHFTHWNDGDTNAERTVVVTSDSTFTAYFEADEVVTTYTVTVVSANPEMGTVSAGGEVEEGESFTIRAIANEGYHFTHWNDGDVNAERTVVVTSDTTFTAYFEADEVVTTYTVTVVSANPEMGAVSAGGEVEEGESFTIRAIANEGYYFTHWNDGDTNAERTVVVTSDTTFTAYFEADGGTEGIGGIEAVNAKVYAEHGRIVVEGVEGETVSVFDVAGRQVKNSDLHAGVYMVKIGSAPARKVVVTR